VARAADADRRAGAHVSVALSRAGAQAQSSIMDNGIAAQSAAAVDTAVRAMYRRLLGCEQGPGILVGPAQAPDSFAPGRSRGPRRSSSLRSPVSSRLTKRIVAAATRSNCSDAAKTTSTIRRGLMKKWGSQRGALAATGKRLALALLLGTGAASAETAQAAQAAETGDTQQITAHPFWKDATGGYMFRAATFDRWSNGDPNLPGSAFKWAGGGIGAFLFGNTGEIADVLSFGATYNFVLPIWSPEDDAFNFILKDPDQSGYGVFGELNARVRLGSNTVVIGRQTIRNQWFMDGVYRFFNKLDQGMIGPRDIRNMNWLTYEGVTLQGRAFDDSVRYYGGYVNRIKQVNEDEFLNLYQGAWNVFQYPMSTREGDSDGMAYVGMNWKPTPNSMVSTSYNNVQNMLNMFYVDYDHVFRFEGTQYFRAAVQWMYQESNGQSLMRGVNGNPGPTFNTNYGGIYLESRPVPWWIPYFAAGITSDRNQIYSPFSLGPSYLIQRIGENSLAGEHTWILGTTLDFASFGLNGLSFDVSYGQRSNRNVNGNPNLPVADWNETATDLIYVFPRDGFFKNLRARARWASALQKGNTWSPALNDIVYVNYRTTDVRFDLQLNIPFR
jgi:hypothetical protein